ncbi:MAG: phosphoglucomutase/phosphomannomutase family protein [Elusimicrobiota bacterium]
MEKQKLLSPIPYPLSPAIKFGTDGWRGIIARDFTFENVGIVAQAIADYIKAECSVEGVGCSGPPRRTNLANLHSPLHPIPYPLSPVVIVGYDNRFLSEKFALHVARVISANGIHSAVSQTAATSPSVSFFCKKNNCLGVMITASHNPPDWNGLKIKLQYGGSVSEKIINTISKHLYKSAVKTNNEDIQQLSLRGRSDDLAMTRRVDIISDYKKYLKSLVRLNPSSKSKIVLDYMHGSGVGIFESVCGGFKNDSQSHSESRITGRRISKIYSIHNSHDPLFAGVNPEPIEKNLTELKKVVLKNGAAVGFAFDGDADRLGVIDDKGRYLSPHIVFPLILLYLVEGRKIKGKVVQAISLGYLSERIAKKFCLPFEEVPVGFKYVCEKMLAENVLLGGEESGGYGWKGSIPERDGILNALLITEMLSQTKKKLSQLVDDLQKRFGKSYYLRRDIKLSKPVDKQEFVKQIEQKIRPNSSAFGGNSWQFASRLGGIKEIRTYDGIKIIFDPSRLGGTGWLLLRPSGTEPILRTYSETDSLGKTKKLLDFAEKICDNLTTAKQTQNISR